MIKMGFLFSQSFWGIFFILLGLSMVIRVLFNIHVPLIRLTLAFILIYAGIATLINRDLLATEKSFVKGEKGSIIFNSGSINSAQSGEYNIIFGSGTIKLRDPDILDKKQELNINTIFGSGILKIKESQPVMVVADSPFSSVSFPDGHSITFNSYTYRTKAFAEDKPYVLVKVDVVFGSFYVVSD